MLISQRPLNTQKGTTAMPIDTLKTGAAIAACRQQKNLSQQGLAGLMNVTHQAVSKWEKGQALPDTETLLALSKLFGVSMEALLTGELPASKEETESAAKEKPETPIPQAPAMDYNTLMGMLPFVSHQTADRLFTAYANTEHPNADRLVSLAPFVSTKALNEFILAHPLSNYTPQMLGSLAPFLPTATVDQLIQGLTEPVPAQYLHLLAPFASPKVVDAVVLNGFDMDGTAGAVGSSKHIHCERSDQSMPNGKSALHQTQRESPRMRLARKAVEDRNEHWLCEYAEELEGSELRTLCFLLLEKKMYGPLEELIHEAADPELQHALLDHALETNHQQLLDLLSKAL